MLCKNKIITNKYGRKNITFQRNSFYTDLGKTAEALEKSGGRCPLSHRPTAINAVSELAAVTVPRLRRVPVTASLSLTMTHV